MIILALDTCLAQCAACLFDSAGKRILAQEAVAMERGHAEALAPMVQRVLAGQPAPERIAVTTGPGTFTGLRIGLSFARAFGLARGLPVIGLDTLHALRLCTDEKADIALKNGESGLAYLLRAGQHEIALVAAEGLQFTTILPDPGKLAAWAARAPTPSAMPEPIYIRNADAKPQIAVTPAGAGAAKVLAELHHGSFPQAWSANEIADMFAIKGTSAFVAQAGGEAMGFILVREIAGEAEIITLCVAPARRGLGIASRLVETTLGAAPKFFLEVAARNTAARRLYAKHGFKETGLRKSYYADGDDAVLMTFSRA